LRRCKEKPAWQPETFESMAEVQVYDASASALATTSHCWHEPLKRLTVVSAAIVPKNPSLQVHPLGTLVPAEFEGQATASHVLAVPVPSSK